MKINEITLEGENVKLFPLNMIHVNELFEAVDSSEIWSFLPSRMETLEDMTHHISEALQEKEQDIAVPFVVFDKELNKIVGMTRLQDISVDDRSLEIGYTWYSSKVWRTRVNTECKYLLLTYCFEELNTIRVQFRVDRINTRSIKAVLRLGATEEGVKRKDRILYNGRVRDTAFFSIIDDEWPKVKDRLVSLLTNAKEHAHEDLTN